MKTITYEELLKQQQDEIEKIKAIPLVERLPDLVKKMVRIVRGRTGGSEVYVDMLLSLLPNSSHKVSISDWCYRADRTDFQTVEELMAKSGGDIIWEYKELVMPYEQELLDIASTY